MSLTIVAHKPSIKTELAPPSVPANSLSDLYVRFACVESSESSDTTITLEEWEGTMTNIKFVVKVNRGGAHAPQYVLRMDRLPIQTTTNRKLALVMGRLTAEDAVKSMQNSHCSPELVSVRVSA
jgi:hypothetical protein